jgi:hypothetical protein
MYAVVFVFVQYTPGKIKDKHGVEYKVEKVENPPGSGRF